jgi:hypothetical protein
MNSIHLVVCFLDCVNDLVLMEMYFPTISFDDIGLYFNLFVHGTTPFLSIYFAFWGIALPAGIIPAGR